MICIVTNVSQSNDPFLNQLIVNSGLREFCIETIYFRLCWHRDAF